MKKPPTWLKRLGFFGLGLVSGTLIAKVIPEDVAFGLVLPLLLLLLVGCILEVINIDREIAELRKKIAQEIK
jgi:hypothetical protein